MPESHEIRALLAVIVSCLVNEPSQIEIETVETEETATFILRVAPADVGRLLGKGGQQARAIRTLLGGMQRKHFLAFKLKIHS